MSKTILFFGSGPVAATSLELLAQTFVIEAVVTKPKPEHHKGTFPVLEVSDRLKLPIHTASNKAELSELFTAKTFESDVAVLIDFGIIVGQDVIDYFPLGIVNSHFSLLPEWRGADPITFAILSGQKQTGVSLMLLVERMDEGPLLAQSTVSLAPTITTPVLTGELIELSYKMLEEILPLYMNGELRPYEQPSDIKPTYSRKLSKDDGVIDWTKSAEVIEREIRAFIGWPKSRTTIAGKDIVITKAHVVEKSGQTGSIEASGKELVVYCEHNALVIEMLTPAGKNEMTAESFLAGHRHLL